MHFHEFLTQFPEILANTVRRLSADLFSESIKATTKKQGKEAKKSNNPNKNTATELKAIVFSWHLNLIKEVRLGSYKSLS